MRGRNFISLFVGVNVTVMRKTLSLVRRALTFAAANRR